MLDIIKVSKGCWAIHIEESKNHLVIHIFKSFDEACDFALKHSATQDLFNNILKELNQLNP